MTLRPEHAFVSWANKHPTRYQKHMEAVAKQKRKIEARIKNKAPAPQAAS